MINIHKHNVDVYWISKSIFGLSFEKVNNVPKTFLDHHLENDRPCKYSL